MIAAIWAWEHYNNRNISWEAAKWVPVSFLLASFFSVWYSSRPRLYAEIFSRISATTETKHVVEVMAIELQNTGEATSIRSWLLEVTTPDKRKHRGSNSTLPDTISIQQGNNRPIIYHASDSIFEKAFRDPIQQGKILSGVLLVGFDDVSESELSDERSQFRLTFTDISGKSHEAVNKATRKGTITLFPGLGPQ